MKTKMFKKVISIVLTLMLVCSLFTGTLATNVSAENDVPAYDAAQHKKLVSNGGSVNIDTPFERVLDVKDKAAATYVQYKVTFNAEAIENGGIAPSIVIADVTYNGQQYDLMLRMTGKYGHTLGLASDGDYYNGPTDVYNFWSSMEYPDTENLNCGSEYIITVKTEGNSIDIWWNEYYVSIGETWDLTDLSVYGMTVNGAKVGAGYNYGILDYTVAVEAWTAISNHKYALPTFDAEKQSMVQSLDTTGKITNYDAPNFFGDFSGLINETGVAYTSFKVYLGGEAVNTYDGPVILLAETDYTEGPSDTNKWYLGLRLTRAAGWTLALYNDVYSDTVHYIVDNQHTMPYASGTGDFADGIQVVAKIDDGKATVWLEGKCVAKEWSKDAFNITKPVLGARSLGNGYAVKEIKVWTDKANYKYTVPQFDADTQMVIKEDAATGWYPPKSDGTNGDNPPIEWALDAADTSKAVYTTYTDDAQDYSTGIYYGKTVYIGKVGSDIYGLRLAKGYGVTVGKIIDGLGQVYGGSLSLPTQNYPNGTQTKSKCTVTVKVENSKVTLWIGETLYIKEQYVEGLVPAIGAVIWTQTGLDSLKVKTWTDKTNYKWALPTYDENDQYTVQSFDSTGKQENGGATFFDNFTDLTNNAEVYTSFVVNTSSKSGYNGPVILLAETDYTEGPSDTNKWYLGIRFTMENGWTLALFNDVYSDGYHYVVNSQEFTTYADGTKNFKDGTQVVTKIGNGKATIWLEGKCVAKEWSKDAFNITKPVLGARTLGWGYAIKEFSAWTDNENYGKLGDINADRDINILDFIGMHKLAAGETGVAFNDAVKSFNNEGTINNKELIMMKKYLLGVIDTLTVTD